MKSFMRFVNGLRKDLLSVHGSILRTLIRLRFMER